ncbi:hypothetical protein [Alloyangia pacifica]|uniref:hypothetical protein n=1 Tax=Alloyangia pacifica TaxID=311180 RepID=UPI001CD31425|nr:hypothetical protein [Alloyangia pacifica]MCA0996989.1 hypothetical protein [Alloyangia pacifica]
MARARMTALALLTAVSLAATPALPCAFHNVLPERTAADWLVEGSALVLARPDPENPFAFAPVEVLRGEVPSDLDAFVDSVSRRRLAAAPENSVLFARDGARWVQVAYVDADFRPVMRRILKEGPEWTSGFDARRFALFAGLQDHRDRELRNLALREIDKAPYAELRRIKLRLGVAALMENFYTPVNAPYQPIRALLLGLEGSEAARRVIHSTLEGAAHGGQSPTLGAFATALVEIDGAEGVALLEEKFLADPAQPLAKLELVVEALAIQHGVGSAALQGRISAALQGFVQTRPEGAALVARQFISRRDWSQAATLEAMMQAQRFTSSETLLPVAIYVGQAKQAM